MLIDTDDIIWGFETELTGNEEYDRGFIAGVCAVEKRIKEAEERAKQK